MEPDPTVVATRRALHGVAELVLAGPQHATSGEIALRVVPGGFATVTEPLVRLERHEVVLGDARAAVAGSTPRGLAAALGLEARRLDEVYPDGAGVDLDDVLELDEGAADRLTDAWSAGDAALRRLDPSQEPVLWPEHFDVGISLGEVNYGVSPGDSSIPVPYAYVGPWQVPEPDDFWDRPFGTARLMSDLGDAPAVLAFFDEARRRLGS